MNDKNSKKIGRPVGSKSKETLKRQEIEAELKQSIMRFSDKLVKAQINVAEGCTYLYEITYDKNNKPSKPTIITDKDTIENFLMGELKEVDKKFYYITTKTPDVKAIDSLLDRAFGKAKQQIGIEGEVTVNKYDGLSEEELAKRISDLIGSTGGKKG